MATEIALLRLPDPHDLTRVSWIDAAGVIGDGSWEEAAAACRGRVQLAVPGEWVNLLTTEIPSRSRAQLLQAIPFALEEQLAEDVDQLHFALGSSDTGSHPVAVIAHRRMEEMLALAHQVGLRPQRLLPEPLLLPWEATAWGVLVEGSRVTLRSGREQGMSLQREAFPFALSLALEEQAEHPPEALRVVAPTQDDDSSLDDPAQRDLGVPEPPIELIEQEPLAVMAATLSRGAAGSINLLQGRYSASDKLMGQWRLWRAAAAVAMLWIAAQFASGFVELNATKQESRRLFEYSIEVVKETFPEITRVPNPRVQMESKIKALREGGQVASSGGVLMALQHSGAVLAKAKEIELSNLSYRGNRLELVVSANDLQSLDRLKRDLDAIDSIEAELQSASSEGSRVQGRLRIAESRP